MMSRRPNFRESAMALEGLVSRRRSERRIDRLLYQIGDALRGVFGLPHHYYRQNEIRERLVDVMTPYLAGELLPDERAWVDELLATEPLCRQMAAPLIAAWSVPRGREEMPPAEVVAAWSRFQREIAARHPGRGGDV